MQGIRLTLVWGACRKTADGLASSRGTDDRHPANAEGQVSESQGEAEPYQTARLFPGVRCRGR